MLTIGIDLTLRSAGICILNGKKLRYDSIEVKDKSLSEFEIIKRIVDWLFGIIDPYLQRKHLLIIEDVFYGKNFKSVKLAARMQGAFTNKYYVITGREPKYMMAISARKNLSVRTRGRKAEIQLFVIDTFKLGTVDADTRNELKELVREYTEKRISKYVFNKRTRRLSTRIKKQTGIDEHMADAIVLALSERSG